MRRSVRVVLCLAVAVAAVGGSLAGAVEGVSQHVVQEGDTLSAIALRYGVALDQLAALNGLTNPDLIRVGQPLRLADPAAPQAPPSSEYVVRPGDTLESIARAYGVSVAALIEANRLDDPDRLIVGQKLTIRGQAAATPAPAMPVTPLPSAPSGPPEVAAALERQAERYGLDPALLKALAWQASGWRQDRVGPNGTVGVLQISPATFAWVEQTLLKRPLDRTGLDDGVEAGAAYLAYLLKRGPDERTALAAYLQGPASVRANGILARTERALEELAALRQRFSGAARPAQPQPSAVEAAVRAAIAGIGVEDARVGVSALNLATGERLELRATEQFPAASTIKAGIMAELFRQIEAGKLRWSDQLRADVERMITLSDNDAADRLMDLVTPKAVNEGFARLGLKQTALRSHYASRRPGDSGLNVTSPADLARFFGELASGRVVSEAASRQMLDLLSQTRDSSKLRRGLPPGTRVAHKSGWFSGVANDAGVVFAPRATYVVAVLTEGTPDGETGNRLVAAVSRALYDAWGR